MICKNITRVRARKDVTNAPPCRSWLLPLPMLFCHNALLSSFSCYILTTKLRLYFESCKKRKTKIIPTTQCEDDLLYIVIRCVFYFTSFLIVPSLILRMFNPFCIEPVFSPFIWYASTTFTSLLCCGMVMPVGKSYSSFLLKLSHH